jgi:glycosyltransferase involved in cell wall biosynthesis
LIPALLAEEPDLRLTAWVGRGWDDRWRDQNWAGQVRWVSLPMKSAGSPVRLAYELCLLGMDARLRRVDVVHGLAYACPVIAPGVATVVTLLDLTWHHHPTTVTPAARRMFQMLTATCGRSADRVIATSETVKRDLVRTAGIREAKIDVTPLGSPPAGSGEQTGAASLRSRLELPDHRPVLLCVGQIAPHKNHEVLLRALPMVPDAMLVVVGRTTAHQRRLAALSTELGVADRVRWTGFVDAPTLEALYTLADVLVFPSLSEGFGLPIVEAMARGVPVACCDRGAAAETAGGAAELFDPTDPAALGHALSLLLTEPARRSDRIAAGHARAAVLSWRRTARGTLQTYRRALGR